MRRALAIGLGAVGIALISGAFAIAAGPEGKPFPFSAADLEFFESKVRPILVSRCQSCHGPEKSKGGLRLDNREDSVKGGDSGPAVVPGHPEMSPLVEAIRYDGDTQMPPKGKLKQGEIDLLTEWVKRGAPWPASGVHAASNAADPMVERLRKAGEFWSLRPVINPAPPPVKDRDWAKTPIDGFVLAKLEVKGLHPSAPADRRTLLRRVTFDLMGLPPSPEEVEAFVKDEAADAYERVVERLLASPRYGERWGRHWLDLARYGEDQAHSFQPRLYPQGFRYRDWVTDALNRDLPYDRFLLEQIAGDLLDEPGKDARLPALGFFALGPVYYGDAKKHDQVDDRIDTLTRGVLGLTVACARCHDHKYDPIPTTDYYALAGVFHGSDYREAPLVPKAVVEAFDKAQAGIKAKSEEIDAFLKRNGERLARERAQEASKYVLAVWKLRNRRADKADLKAREFAKAEGLDGSLLEKWNDYLTGDAPGRRPMLAPWNELVRSKKPDAKLASDPAALAEAGKAADAIGAAVRDVIGRKGGVALASTDKPDKAKTASDAAPNSTLKPLNDAEKALFDDLLGESGLCRVPKGKMEAALPEDARKTLKGMRSELDKAKAAAPPKYPVTHTLTDASAVKNMPVLIRGNAATPGEVVPRRFLTALGGGKSEFKSGSGRLELARAIADARNPLTARVFVNRVWQHYFGRGLVNTPSNFGALGERPTHPELLDHLASDFMKHGWSIKSLHRSILLSATYRQSSTDDPHATEVDPENRLLWRMSRKRLEVEPWRDAMLAVSGRLDPTIGGPSVPVESLDNTRRTYYAKVSRHDLAPLLRLFDFPDPNITSGERSRTTVALQQLLVLNDEFLVRSAQGLAGRLAKVEGDDEARIHRAYALLYARTPTEAESKIGLVYLSAKDLDDPKVKNDLTRWERYAQALLASNEFLFID